MVILLEGLVFVSMYSAWVEEDVEDILRLLDSVEPFEERQQRWPISRCKAIKYLCPKEPNW
jgi:hypothetical protein